MERLCPNQLASRLPEKSPSIYSMAVGAWGAIEYLEIFPKALLFKPRIVIIAYYTGNDAHDSFKMAYANERWAYLRSNVELTAKDTPKVVFPPFKTDSWKVQFKDGVVTTFNAKLRYDANKDHPAIREGYGIMAKVAERISVISQNADVKIVFTIIPTKELVYSEKIRNDSITPPDDYKNLIEVERRNLEGLANKIRNIDGAIYIDILQPLQQAALVSNALYREDWDGHPVAGGYSVIADSLLPTISHLLSKNPESS